MDKMRKILKIIILAIVIFGGMTALLATIITYTSFSEKWSFACLITIATIECSLIAYLVGSLFNSKGLLIGLITSIIGIEALIIAVQLIFFGEINSVIPDIFYIISILFGTVGGIVGVNSNK